MTTYARRLYHIVYGTKARRPTMIAAGRRHLFAYMHGIMKNMSCHLYRLNGVEDHLHILVNLHADVPLSEFVRTLKVSSGDWIRREGVFSAFDHWQVGYGSFTVSWEARDAVIEYIKNQEEHHRRETFLEEYRRLVEAAGMTWDEEHEP